jgi:hypothetical protein
MSWSTKCHRFPVALCGNVATASQSAADNDVEETYAPDSSYCNVKRMYRAIGTESCKKLAQHKQSVCERVMKIIWWSRLDIDA